MIYSSPYFFSLESESPFSIVLGVYKLLDLYSNKHQIIQVMLYNNMSVIYIYIYIENKWQKFIQRKKNCTKTRQQQGKPKKPKLATAPNRGSS